MNENYQDFLGLGDTLKGGEEKVEEVRLGILGFQREVDTLRKKVEVRRQEIEALVQERREITRKERLGRNLLEVETKLVELEEGLEVQTNGYTAGADSSGLDFSGSEEDSDEEEAPDGVLLSRLSRRTQQYLYLRKLVNKVGASLPFLLKQETRFRKVRQTLLLDLNNALAQARSSGGTEDSILKLLSLYRDIGEPAEALRVIKRSNKR